MKPELLTGEVESMRGQELLEESRQGEAVVIAQPNVSHKKLYIESYGCQMNFSDSEIVASILAKEGFGTTPLLAEADLVLLNTCAIRDNAEQRIRNRLKELDFTKRNKPGMLVGVLGCMAERLKTKFLEEEQIVDIVVGPDAYRDLPRLVEMAETGQRAVNVLLSKEETYGEIAPVRLSSNGVSAFISITRGCDNMCSFCVVPFTRGRERSREPDTIVAEARDLFEQGYREVTLLGQNVDSYLWYGGGPKKDFDTQPEEIKNAAVTFAALLEKVALIDPRLRVRFSTSNPRDMTDEVLHVMAKHPNICRYIHLPVQSGSSRILEKMNRGHDRKWYLERIQRIKSIMPEVAISTDMICGFCDEEESDHLETVSLMKEVGFSYAFMFYYSERPGTPAAKKLADNVPLEEKKRRLNEVIQLQQQLSLENNLREIGKVSIVLVEGFSKRSDDFLAGRNSQNKVVVFPKENYSKGEYVEVLIEECTPATLIGKPLKKVKSDEKIK